MTEPFDPEQLSFSDLEQPPVPNVEASRDYQESEPPPATTGSGGFRGFASRSSRTKSRGRKETKRDIPMAVKVAIPNRKGQFIEPLMKMYGMVGTGLMMVDPICGTAVLNSAQKCAETVDELAYQNETVRKVIWSLTRTSLMGAVIVAHMPIIMAVVMHHVPAAQQAFGMMGANMMEDMLKQSTPESPSE